jgi:RNA polymerase sigma-70 factor (ECF subfamily)
MSHLSPVPSGGPSPQGTGPSTLSSLIRLSARGDEQAFTQLYDETSARVFGLVLRVIRDRAQAEEVTQEVFLQVWRTASRYDESKGSALSWLMTLAHRRAVDRVRAAEAASRQDTSYHQNSYQIEHDATAEAAESSMEARRVRSALEELTTVQREALELAYFGGYTHTEVASMLDLPVGTAKTRIRDGLIRLRDAMGVGQ